MAVGRLRATRRGRVRWQVLLASSLFLSLGVPAGWAQAAISVRLRWRPSDARAAGYFIYYHRAGAAFGEPVDTGLPLPVADGTVSYRLGGIEAGVDYVFAVAAYASDRRRSEVSNAMWLHQPGGCQLDADCHPVDDCSVARCTQGACTFSPRPDGTTCGQATACAAAPVCRAGLCDLPTPVSCDDRDPCTDDVCAEPDGCANLPRPGCVPCATDHDCEDDDPCTASTRCAEGRCERKGRTCTPSGPCVTTRCQPGIGCVEQPLPDGTNCDGGDPCRTSTCEASACVIRANREDVPLVIRRFVMRPRPKAVRLTAHGSAEPPLLADPATHGLRLILRAEGGILLDADFDARAFAFRGHRRVLVRPGARHGGAVAAVRALVIHDRHGQLDVRLRAVLPPATPSPAAVAWDLRQGSACAAADMVCMPASRATRCN